MRCTVGMTTSPQYPRAWVKSPCTAAGYGPDAGEPRQAGLRHRLLLRDAVDAAAVFVDAVHLQHHDLAVGVERGQGFGGVAVAGGVESMSRAPYVVENRVHEPGLRALFRHETRWARTIRSVQPGGYALSFVTETMAVSLLAAWAVYLETASPALAAIPVAAAMVLRWTLHFAVQRQLADGRALAPWLIALRDVFSLSVRIGSFFGRGVSWRGQELTVRAESRLDPLTPPRGPRPDVLEASQ